MAIEKTRSLRKASGGRLHPNRKSRQYAKVNQPILTKVAPTKTKKLRVAGANIKQKLLSADKIAVADKTGKITLVVIDGVAENAANANFVQRDIFNKGAIVKTKLGNVKVTSRPGQSANLSGVLVE